MRRCRKSKDLEKGKGPCLGTRAQERIPFPGLLLTEAWVFHPSFPLRGRWERLAIAKTRPLPSRSWLCTTRSSECVYAVRICNKGSKSPYYENLYIFFCLLQFRTKPMFFMLLKIGLRSHLGLLHSRLGNVGVYCSKPEPRLHTLPLCLRRLGEPTDSSIPGTPGWYFNALIMRRLHNIPQTAGRGSGTVRTGSRYQQNPNYRSIETSAP
jgi:hypothetical protein